MEYIKWKFILKMFQNAKFTWLNTIYLKYDKNEMF